MNFGMGGGFIVRDCGTELSKARSSWKAIGIEVSINTKERRENHLVEGRRKLFVEDLCLEVAKEIVIVRL